MKIVFITENPYWQRDHHRFGLDYLMEKGYDVEIWRIITNRSIKFTTQAGMYEGDNFYEVPKRKFRQIVLNNRKSVFYSGVADKSLLFPVMDNGCRYFLICGVGAIMECSLTPKQEMNSLECRVKRWLEIGLIQSIKNLLNNISDRNNQKKYFKLQLKNPPRLIVTSTHYAADRYLFSERKANNVLHIHSMDYDRYLEARESKTEQCILYCDSGFFDIDQDQFIHPRSISTLEHREECLNQLDLFFSKLEKYYGLPVIVAGHPHVKYLSDTFCGRKVEFNKTHDLAANAILFVLQTSTAISFAALFDLPMLQVVNSYFKEFEITQGEGICAYDNIKYQADVLGSGFLDLDDIEKAERPWDYVKRMDPDKRKDYIEKYIIDSDKTDKLIVEYVEEFLRTQQYEQNKDSDI